MFSLDHDSQEVHTSPTGEFSPDAIRAQVEAVSASSVFANSARMQRFLKVVVEYTLSGRIPGIERISDRRRGI